MSRFIKLLVISPDPPNHPHTHPTIHTPTQPPTHPLNHPPMGGGVPTNHKSSNRIELS